VTVSKPRLQRWIDGIVDRGYAPKTIHNIRMVVTEALGEAVDLGLLRDSPARGLIVPPVELAKKEIWTTDEVRVVLDFLADDPFWHALYRLILMSTSRPGEGRA